MAETDEFYRSLCSTETLRSGKKGFFHDFSDYVISTVGDAWTSKIFARIRDDEERVKIIFADEKTKNIVLEVLDRVQPLYRDKDAEISRKRRLEGLLLASSEQYDKALLLLSQAVLRAPVTGRCKTVDQGFTLPLALLARAEIFVALKEYEVALEDLKMASENELPDKSRLEMQRKKEECERFLAENKLSLVAIESKARERRGQGQLSLMEHQKRVTPSISGGVNSKIPSASSSLEIRETSVAGKHVVARTEIQPGDILVVEAPLASCLLPEFYGTHCQHCYSRLRAPVGCPNCSTVAFCGRKCRDVALSTYHGYECKILALLIGSGMSILSMLAFRMVTQAGLKKCLKAYDRLRNRETSKNEDEGNEPSATTTTAKDTRLSKSAKRRLRKKKLKESKNIEGSDEVHPDDPTMSQGDNDDVDNVDDVDVRVYDLVTHSSRRSARDFLERTLMAAFLLKCLRRVNFFNDPSPKNELSSCEEIAIGALLLKNLQLLQFNAHEFFETRRGPEHRFRGSKPLYLGVAIYPTVARFNHDCYPAVTRYFVDKNIVIRATRTVKPGEVVAENYGPIFTKRSFEDRQRSLAGRYWFKCTCQACKEDWPGFETLSNEQARLKCLTEGCTQLHSRSLVKNKEFKCLNCRKKIDLSGRLRELVECEESYSRGLAKMEEEMVEEAIDVFISTMKKFHEIAAPPHKDTHLAEIALSACMADSGNTWDPIL